MGQQIYFEFLMAIIVWDFLSKTKLSLWSSLQLCIVIFCNLLNRHVLVSSWQIIPRPSSSCSLLSQKVERVHHIFSIYSPQTTADFLNCTIPLLGALGTPYVLIVFDHTQVFLSLFYFLMQIHKDYFHFFDNTKCRVASIRPNTNFLRMEEKDFHKILFKYSLYDS